MKIIIVGTDRMFEVRVIDEQGLTTRKFTSSDIQQAYCVVGGLRELCRHRSVALLTRFRPYYAGGRPEAETATGDGEFRPHVEPATLQVEQQAAPIVRTFSCAIDKTDELLLALRRRPDQHEDALLLVLETRFEVDSVRPDVNVAFA